MLLCHFLKKRKEISFLHFSVNTFLVAPRYPRRNHRKDTKAQNPIRCMKLHADWFEENGKRTLGTLADGKFAFLRPKTCICAVSLVANKLPGGDTTSKQVSERILCLNHRKTKFSKEKQEETKISFTFCIVNLQQYSLVLKIPLVSGRVMHTAFKSHKGMVFLEQSNKSQGRRQIELSLVWELVWQMFVFFVS